ncbi:MAG: hypothetical protein MJ193_01665, partial [Clostridia bacterium]|nr:hypothetical protein [Clostridia bacterium]
EELNAKFNYLTVTIDRARILLNVDFADDKQYAGNNETTQKLVLGTDYVKGSTDFILYGEDAIGFKEGVWEEAAQKITATSYELYYSMNGGKNANVAVDKDGNVLKHNIMVSGLVYSDVDAAFDNYALLAYLYDGEGYYEQSLTFAVYDFDFEIIEIATLNQKQLKPDISGVNVLDKVYDGTKNATVTMGDITKIGVLEEEKDYIELVFTGLFETKDYSGGDGKTSKVSINIAGLKNTEAAGDKDYTANYTIVGSLPCTARRTIYQAPIAVNVELASKTYDGTNIVPDANIKANFVDMAKIYPSETDSYYVDYKFACYDGVNVEEVETGTVYGMNIIKTSNNSTINYKLVYADNDATDAISEDMLGNLPTEDADGNAIYYHELPTVSVYVLTEAEYNKYGTPAYIGTYARMGQKYYVVGFDAINPSYDISELTLTTMQVFNNAKASITPKQIKLSVVKKEGTTAFTKAYDGTNKFEGVVNDDYVIEKTSAFVGDDADYIALNPEEVSAKFLRTSAGKTSVEFSFTADVLKAAESAVSTDYEIIFKNYSCESSVVLLSGEITKLQITALLANTSITYGDVPASFADKISYSANKDGADYALEIVDGKAYLAEADYDVFFANYLATFEDDAAREAMKLTKLYEFVDGEFVFAESGREGGKSYYIVLDGSFVAPTVSSNVSTATKVGTYNYKLVGGSATDYVFVNTYEGGATSATLTVEKADLIVRVKGETGGCAYSKYYGYASPAILFQYEGFKNNDGAALVSGMTAEFRLFEDGVDTGVAIDDYAEISSLLAENQFYGAVITNAGTALNYNIIADNTKIVKLDISIEPIVGVKFTDKTVAYNGNSRADAIVPANVPEGATITYKYMVDGQEVAASALVNAGVYNVEATIVKSFDG